MCAALFLEPKPVDTAVIIPVGLPDQNSGKHEADKARILGVLKAPPSQIIGELEDRREIQRQAQLCEAVEPKEFWGNSDDKRCERRGSNARHLSNCRNIIGRA